MGETRHDGGAGHGDHQPREARWVDVAPERFPGWLERFGVRHGGEPLVRAVVDGVVVVEAPDGERAECHAPPGAPAPADLDALVAEATRARRLGILLARRGGFAVGVAVGPELIASKVDSRYVQSRTAAGGWSQQRFARRRENQAKAAAGDAAEVCVRLLLPEAGRLAALVTGGDRRAVDAVLADARLAPLRPLVASRFLTVPDPKAVVLAGAVPSARAVAVRVVPAGT